MMAVKRKTVTACFNDLPGSPLDTQVNAVFKKHGGELVGSGTFLETGDRDVEYKLPVDKILLARKELTELGCKVHE